jgi:hypothetical protein
MTHTMCNNPDMLKAAIRKIVVDCLPVLIAAGYLMSPAAVFSQDAAAYPPPQCSPCSPLANQSVVGDRSIVPFKIYAVFLEAGSHLDVVVSGRAETVGRFDLSLYGPQTGEFDFDHATCLARAFGGGITSKNAEVPGQPTLDSGCQPNEPPEAQSKQKPVPKVAHPPADQAKRKPEAKAANPPADQVKQKPAPKIVGSKAHVEYIAPLSGWYFVALQFYGSGVQVVLQHKEI